MSGNLGRPQSLAVPAERVDLWMDQKLFDLWHVVSKCSAVSV